jgi:polar amino acid transport system substrate-binding protein
MSYTEERARKVDFSAPYLRVPMGVLLGPARSADINSAEQLDDAAIVIAVQRGTTGALKARSRFPRAALREFDTEDDAANELIVGRAHAFVYDVVSIRRRHAKHHDVTRVLDADLGTEDYCIAFRKGSPLKAEVDAFLSENGAFIAAKIDEWFPEEQRAGFVR